MITPRTNPIECGSGTYWFELYVDKSDDAVTELAQQYVELKHEAKGEWPGGKLPWEHPCPRRKEPKPPEPMK